MRRKGEEGGWHPDNGTPAHLSRSTLLLMPRERYHNFELLSSVRAFSTPRVSDRIAIFILTLQNFLRLSGSPGGELSGLVIRV